MSQETPYYMNNITLCLAKFNETVDTRFKSRRKENIVTLVVTDNTRFPLILTTVRQEMSLIYAHTVLMMVTSVNQMI